MDKYGKMLNEMNGAIEAALSEGKKMRVYYSAYKTDSDGNPINNLRDVAVEGKVILTQGHDEFWGDGEPYQSDVIENPTWLDLAILANDMIEMTGDYHHIFLEKVYPVRVADLNTYEPKVVDGVQFYEFCMGS